MKSHDLAKLLLSQPNLEIYHYDAESDLHYQNFDNKLMVTPSGIFTTVKPTSVSENVLTPYETPLLGHVQIFFKDGTITPKLEGSSIQTVLNLESGLIFNIPYEKPIVLLGKNQSAPSGNQNAVWYTPDDIDFISVLTEYDPNTWHETWENMSYDEAIECGKNLAKMLFPQKEELSQEQIDSFSKDFPDSEFNVKVSPSMIDKIEK
ncbi:TPA: hypothetical protein ACT2UD_004722 [Escherichia coli]|uniref:Uncharacterized protein n=1 Tax=Escherichia phage SP27 TaxID=2495557 RepID=A0A5A4U6D6_9CAUD|nr:hypothetical protein [Escherichia coli]BBM62080.1 hypothetical protein EO157G_4910 [Escherichia phage SP27]EFJ0711799.1 hypothetical protein [Escherichia coli]MDI1143771.1 hypothetical protein [Escherichia coli]GCJ79967.1 hypothetical protein BvCmsB5655_03193 [Escherichia coli]HBB9485822.1 hypothetical protein [Escherichia coli]